MSFEPVAVYLGLGSNLGSREDNISKAMELLSQRLRMGKVSSIYDTEPVGEVNQPRFLNMVCQVTTTLPPASLLTLLQGFELKLGRLPGKPNSPRSIDIDILLYGDQVISVPGLTIPHSRIAERAFVLVPLAEIAPDLIHPVLKKTVKELLSAVSGRAGVVKWQAK